MICLCDDVTRFIHTYVCPKWLYGTNKDNYRNYVIKYLTLNDTLVRRVIRNDRSFILENILDHNIYKLIKRKRYIYKSSTYKNYVEFMIYYSIMNESTNCINIIKNKFGNYLIKNK